MGWTRNYVQILSLVWTVRGKIVTLICQGLTSHMTFFDDAFVVCSDIILIGAENRISCHSSGECKSSRKLCHQKTSRATSNLNVSTWNFYHVHSIPNTISGQNFMFIPGKTTEYWRPQPPTLFTRYIALHDRMRVYETVRSKFDALYSLRFLQGSWLSCLTMPAIR